MTLLKYTIFFCTIFFTITTDAKISMHNIQNSVSHFFTKNKQETVLFQEFKDVHTLELLCQHGNISIHTWKQPTTVVEIKKTGAPTEQTTNTVDFIHYEHLLQIKPVTQDKKSAIITDITIIVPEQTSVKISNKKGNICIKNLDGTIEAHTHYGNIEVVDGSHNATVHSDHGNIVIQRESMHDTDTIKATTDQGSIALQVPQHINSTVQASTKSGKIYSDLFVTLESKTTKLTDMVYKQQKQELKGTIYNDYDASISGIIILETKQGTIKIKNHI